MSTLTNTCHTRVVFLLVFPPLLAQLAPCANQSGICDNSLAPHLPTHMLPDEAPCIEPLCTLSVTNVPDTPNCFHSPRPVSCVAICLVLDSFNPLLYTVTGAYMCVYVTCSPSEAPANRATIKRVPVANVPGSCPRCALTGLPSFRETSNQPKPFDVSL